MKLSTPMLSMVSLATAFTLLICSCKSKRQARFEITNSTGHTIKNLTIQPDIDVNKYVDIEPNQKVIFKTSMTGMPKADGNYGLSFQGVDSFIDKTFGYFSNSLPLESITRIDIRPDTIIFKYEYNDY